MEMHDINDACLQLDKSASDEFCHFDMMSDLFPDEDYLIGLDVNLANIDTQLLELDDRVGPSSFMQESHENEISSCFPLKTSPWHESDSGVSEAMSNVGSPPGQTQTEKITDDSFLTQTKFKVQNTPNNEINNELFKFLYERKEVTRQDHVKIREVKGTYKATASGRPSRKCSKRKFDFSDDDSSNSDEHMIPMTKKPATVQSSESEVSAHKFANVINVLKMVKPSTCTSDTTTEDIMKALDDRSKKNAHQAKINREKKKLYIKKLEDDRECLLKENSKLSSQVEQMTEERLSLETEVEYLKSVLANASALSGLLKNISNIKEVKLSASLTSGKRVHDNDHSYNLVRTCKKRSRDVSENMKNAGVCLHVNNGEACLEFCAHCSSLAQKTHGYSDTSQ